MRIGQTPNVWRRLEITTLRAAVLLLLLTARLRVINNDGLVTITITVGGTVKEGDYLALEVLNNDTVGHDITTDGSSSLSSPSTDPGYPLPEMSAVILLSFGLQGWEVCCVQKEKGITRKYR